ncbi:MAG: hypothetical protein BEN18_00410 [Epulopiscium sp. Nuni2H_MBin001]|nr:MAG: hypothetical protein BEN18_00410 [Epulopiscium sp. Nuni2H_MBin001]
MIKVFTTEEDFTQEMDNSAVSIYGIGGLGQSFLSSILRNRIKYFIVSNNMCNDETKNVIRDVPIINISKYKSHILENNCKVYSIILAASNYTTIIQMQHEIQTELDRNNIILNIFPMTEYNKIEDKWKIKGNRVLYSMENKVLYFYSKAEAMLNHQFTQFILKRDWIEKFYIFISGFDDESIKLVNNILLRVYNCSASKFKHFVNEYINIDCITQQEQYLKLKNEFSDKIIEIKPNLFAYKHYQLPCNNFDSAVFYYHHGLKEVKTLYKVKSKSIIDIGGFIGDSILIFNELESNQIYTFEPVKSNFDLLQLTIRLNNIKNVTAEHMALDNLNEGGGEILNYSSGHINEVTDEDRGFNNYKIENVRVSTLDEYVSSHSIEVGLVKINVGGDELKVLEGAKNTICKQQPIILLNISSNINDFFSLKPIIESWNIGYTFKLYKPVDGRILKGTWLIAEILDS